VRAKQISFGKCRSVFPDRELDINDGRQGLTIDLNGETPIYTYFEIIKGDRHVTGREFIDADGNLKRDGRPSVNTVVGSGDPPTTRSITDYGSVDIIDGGMEWS